MELKTLTPDPATVSNKMQPIDRSETYQGKYNDNESRQFATMYLSLRLLSRTWPDVIWILVSNNEFSLFGYKLADENIRIDNYLIISHHLYSVLISTFCLFSKICRWGVLIHIIKQLLRVLKRITHLQTYVIRSSSIIHSLNM